MSLNDYNKLTYKTYFCWFSCFSREEIHKGAIFVHIIGLAQINEEDGDNDDNDNNDNDGHVHQIMDHNHEHNHEHNIHKRKGNQK